MIYETFLFTRNQKRDFTAFIRPGDLTNREVSTIASALNNVNNISDLTPQWPSIYSFAMGQYLLLLRHYNSGRKHAGRDIGVVEGIAVRRSLQRHYALAVPHFVAHQEDVLAIAAQIGDIETLTVEPSAERDWPDVQAEKAQITADDDQIAEFAARLETDRLFLPFTSTGRRLLISALSDPRLRTAFFAFGTNAQVLSRLNQASVNVDIVSYFNTAHPALRNRETNEITVEIGEFTPETPPHAPDPAPVEAALDYPTEILPDPRQVRDAMQQPRSNPEDDPLAQYDAGDDAMLTLREMRRQEHQQQMADTAEPTPQDTRRWLVRLVARLLGRG